MALRGYGRWWWTCALGAPLVVGCGIGVLRDFHGVKVQEIVFDDKCELQEYFDAMASRKIARPTIVRSSDMGKVERDRASGGRSTFRLETDFQLQNFRRLLRENWKDLPPEVLGANALDIEVRWAEKAGARRVVTTESALLTANAKEFELPYQICLNEFLFGEPLYAIRREMLGLPPLDAGAVLVTEPVADAAVDAEADSPVDSPAGAAATP